MIHSTLLLNSFVKNKIFSCDKRRCRINIMTTHNIEQKGNSVNENKKGIHSPEHLHHLNEKKGRNNEC